MNKINNRRITIDGLATMVAKGFEGVGKDISELRKDTIEVKKDILEVKDGNRNIRRDILNLGDRFVSYHTFDQLAMRVGNLEKKK